MGSEDIETLGNMVIYAYCLTPGALWYLHARNIYLTYGNTFGLLSGGDSKFGNIKMWISPHVYLSIIYLEMKWILGYIAILPFIIGLVVGLNRGSRLVVFGIATIGLYYMYCSALLTGGLGNTISCIYVTVRGLAVGLGLKMDVW